MDLEVEETLSPTTSEIDFLTERINEESRAKSISGDAYPFGIFLRKRGDSHATSSHSSLSHSQNDEIPSQELLVGGCNGSVVYGSIYTDQLWLHPEWRGKGLGKKLMEKVHALGRSKGCTSATVGTMSFQGAQKFYESLGYQIEFVRAGYVNNGKMIYLKKNLSE